MASSIQTALAAGTEGRCAPRSSGRPLAVAPALAALALALAPPAGAQSVPDETVADLLRRLDERDEAIRRLEQRVTELERREAVVPAAVAPPPPPPPPPQAALAAVDDDAQPPPGTLDVDPVAAERALERTLVLTGDLLLPPGTADIEPFARYSFNDDDRGRRLVLLDTDGDGATDDALFDTVRTTRNEFEAGLRARLGLPFDSQIEATLPFSLVREQTTTFNTGASENTGSGIGDLRVGFAKTLLREDGVLPDLVGRVTWDTDTGRDSADGVSLDSGFHELGVSFSAIKRQDPLAFVGRVSYERALESDDIRPGDLFGAGVGVVLAASPETSLSFNFDAFYRAETEVSGRAIGGSDQNQGVLSLGVSSIVNRNTLVNFSIGAGFGDDGTDFVATLALPFRVSAW